VSSAWLERGRERKGPSGADDEGKRTFVVAGRAAVPDPHRTLAPDPWCCPASFMVGMLRFRMANQKEPARSPYHATVRRPPGRVRLESGRKAAYGA
jgi:hypothetical protein